MSYYGCLKNNWSPVEAVEDWRDVTLDEYSL